MFFFFADLWFENISSAMVWLKLCLLSLFAVSLAWSEDTLSSQQESTLAHTGEPSPSSTDNLSFPWSRLRLPRYIIPRHYHLLLHPNLTSLSFTGSVQIQIDVQNNTNWVVVHSKGLQISKATILDQNLVLPVLHHPSHEQIGIFSPRVLISGQKYFLYIEFAADFAEGFYGFYKSTYTTTAGETRTLASTHFEPTSARMAFPCFDEPTFKANFSVRIRRTPEYISLSNMPVVKTVELSDGLLEDHFAPSVQMSTYLVAFVVCDFKSVTAKTSSGVQVSIYAAPEKISQAYYALEVGVKMLDFYDEYFNIPYPLPKQDLIAIPDFQSGAMENWGLTTYRETSLLFDPVTSSVSHKLWVTMVIGHELAHQWFGNLVTMEWWNDIWLNEGFARYMEYISVEATYPEFKEYLLNTCFAAVGLDSLNSSRPISSPAENPTQIEEMFDTVSYDKGACVLHMLRHFLTDNVFQTGIVRYLRKYSYRNAQNQDLWDSLTTTCSDEDFIAGNHCYSRGQATKNYLFAGEHLNLTAMMNTWTLQKGVPLVTVTRKGSRLLLRQDRFLRTVMPSDPEWPALQQGYLWHIPLTYKTDASGAVHRHLMMSQTDSIHIGEEVSWVKVNTDMTGYYVVHYADGGWDTITKLLRENHTALSYKDRTHLIHNAIQLVSLPTDVATTVYSVGAREDDGWASLLDTYKTSLSEAQKDNILFALTCSRDTNKLQRLLELGLEGDVIRSQDLSHVVMFVARNPQGHHLAWDFVKKNWDHLVQKFQLGSPCIRNILISTTGQFSSPKELTEVKLFFESIKEQASQLRATQIALDNLKKNVRWVQRNLGVLRSFLTLVSIPMKNRNCNGVRKYV
uniref:Aminopeptidase n=1 Tax=Salarias fasciatus TaxID=181472 RepID=A0A672I739_SALFA